MTRLSLPAVLVGALCLAASPAAQIVLNPEPQEAVIQVEASIGGAMISVGGDEIIRAPGVLYMGPGQYTIEASRQFFETALKTVDVAAGDTLSIRFEMVRSPSTVTVDGLPPDAEIVADGESVEGPSLALPWGAHTVQVRVPGEPDATLRFAVEAGAATTLTYTREGRDTRPAWVNLAAPGSAQLQNGRAGLGALYAGGVTAAFLATVTFEVQRRARVRDFDTARDDYIDAQNEFDVAAARQAVIEAADRIDVVQRRRALVALVGAGLYITSVADAYLFHTRRPTLRVQSPSARWEVGAGGAGLAARLTF